MNKEKGSDQKLEFKRVKNMNSLEFVFASQQIIDKAICREVGDPHSISPKKKGRNTSVFSGIFKKRGKF